MYYRMIRNDIMKSKAVTLMTMLFVTAAAMLVSLAAILVINLVGAIDTMMVQAKTPHFMQMHSGPVSEKRLATFAAADANVDAYQLVEFLNVDNSRIIIDGSPMKGSVQDNGISVQNKEFDYLLDLDGDRIEASDGEVYVPVSYRKDGIRLGAKALICGREFTVAGFLRDSQMNSLLASSKRFLVSRDEFEKLKPYGSLEYLIEFRLKDPSSLSTFESTYSNAGLEANGPTLTYPLFVMLNAVSDGLMIAVILLISLLVVAIAFLCIRFTLLAKLEEDYREIGVMKVIGLRVSDIKRIYLSKYAALVAVGSVTGYACSFLLREPLIENIRTTIGESRYAYVAPVFGLLGILVVFLTIMAFVNGILGRFRKISPVAAIRFGSAQEKGSGVGRFRLSRNKVPNINVSLGIKEVLSRVGIYITMLVVFILSVFIIIVPQSLYNTVSSRDFIAYMGIGECSFRIDNQIGGEDRAAEIAATMDKDKDIDQYVVLTTKNFRVITENGSEERIRVELGDHSVFPVKYIQGSAPVSEDELALSILNADNFRKKVGDTIALVIGGKKQMLTVCGIYSDITNGGKTAKAVFDDSSAETAWSVICASLSNQSIVNNKVLEYGTIFTDAKVTGVDEFVSQTFGSTIQAIKKVALMAIGIAVVITALITLLFIKMLVTKDRYSISVMKALGFNNSDIRWQYLTRAVCTLIIGVVFGTLLANTLGESMAGAVISSFGAAAFHFVGNPVFSYLLCPLVMAGTVVLAALGGTTGVGRIRISDHIKE